MRMTAKIILVIFSVLALTIVLDWLSGYWYQWRHGTSDEIVKYPQGECNFPNEFLWGVSESAYQTEGGNTNDWSAWEKQNADKLAKNAEDLYGKLPIWNDIKTEATSPENYISGSANDHYNRYEEDFSLAKQMGIQSYRISLEWSRIEPREGVFNEAEIRHYRRVIYALKSRGIKPIVNLWHFTNPLWLQEKGGWESPEVVVYFQRYVRKVVQSLGNEVDYWLTMNEPECYASFYVYGLGPIPQKGYHGQKVVMLNLISAHRAAYRVIKAAYPKSNVGVAASQIYYEAYKNKLINRMIKGWVDRWWNYYFLDGVRNQIDFIGLNYYLRCRINYVFINDGVHISRAFWKGVTDQFLNDGGWELYPPGIYHVVTSVSKRYPEKPLYVTEHGLADRRDTKRAWYIQETLRYLQCAIVQGADVRGYFHWSLFDNFEWDKGFWPRFGLIEVDRKTLTRKPRPSSEAYKKIIRQNGVND